MRRIDKCALVGIVGGGIALAGIVSSIFYTPKCWWVGGLVSIGGLIVLTGLLSLFIARIKDLEEK